MTEKTKPTQIHVQYVMPFGQGSGNDLEHEHREMIASILRAGGRTTEATLTHLTFRMLIKTAELADPIKDSCANGVVLDYEHARTKLGDILFYFQAITDSYGFTIDQLREANLATLRKRHPEIQNKTKREVGGSSVPE